IPAHPASNTGDSRTASSMRIYDFLAKKYQGRGRMHMRDQESKRSLLFVPSVWCLTFKVLFCLRCSRLFEIMIINIGVKVDAISSAVPICYWTPP
ncbi:hypothetical protein, partial [Pseudomonas syringae]|uniref:hypothetical protein n=1 Tax=Pseudomonas syringae TaxID=317 RepID=UPI001E46DDCA